MEDDNLPRKWLGNKALHDNELTCLASQFCTELDPAQPQLIQTISYFFFNKRTTRQRLLLLLLFIVSRSCVHMSEDHSLLSAAWNMFAENLALPRRPCSTKSRRKRKEAATSQCKMNSECLTCFHKGLSINNISVKGGGRGQANSNIG